MHNATTTYDTLPVPSTTQRRNSNSTSKLASSTVSSQNAETHDDSRRTPTTHLTEKIASYWWKLYHLEPEGWKKCSSGLGPWSFIPNQYARKGFKVTEVKKKDQPGEH